MSEGEQCSIYVGFLPPNITIRKIEGIFSRFGKILSVDLKKRHKSTFAFVNFEDPRDAEDAVNIRDGFNYEGYRLKVEFPIRGKLSKRTQSECEHCEGRRCGGDERFRGPPQCPKSLNRVFVTGLPSSGSWQDLKDHMRRAGEICFADTYKDGTGVVEFLHSEDMKYAVKNMDDTKFISHRGHISYIRVKKEFSRSPSSDRSRSRSRSYTPSRGRSYSSRRSPRSRSRSPSYGRLRR